MNAEANTAATPASTAEEAQGVTITYECTECGPLAPDLDMLGIDHAGNAHRAVTGHALHVVYTTDRHSGARARANTGPRPVRVRPARGATRGPAVGALPAGDWSDTMPAKLAEPRRVIAFDVYGTPAPKGSMRAVLIRGHARLLEGGDDRRKKLVKAWERAVRDACEAIYGIPSGQTVYFHAEAALYVSIVFHVARSKAAAKRPRPNTRPDVDKLARSTLDALTGVLWVDDGRIADLVLSKRWAEKPGMEGARITVTEAVVL